MYRRRHDELVAALRAEPTPFELVGIAAGLHLTALLPPGHEESPLLRRAFGQSLGLWGLKQHFHGPDGRHGLVLGFSRSSGPQFPYALAALRQVLRPQP